MALVCAPAARELLPVLQEDLEGPAAHAAPPLPPRAAVATLTQNILGAGILALPFAFKSAGLAGGLALLALVYGLSVCSMAALVLLSDHLGEFSYKGFAARTLGTCWPTVVEVWVLCYNLGICISYPILLGDFLSKILQHCGAGAWCSRKLCMSAATVAICWPLSCAQSLGGLRAISLLGIAGIGFTVVAVVKRYADGTYDGPDRGQVVALNPATFGNCFPILVGAFGAHYNIPALYREVAPGARPVGWTSTREGRAAFRRMLRVILGALTLSAAAYGAVGIAVYATFGPATSDDFAGGEDYRANDAWLVVVRATMTVAICASFPLTMVSARMAFFNIVLRPRGCVMGLRLRVGLTTLLTALCLGLALVAGNIGVVLAYNGSVFGTPVCYIAPSVMYLCLPRQSQSRLWRAACFACAAAGVAFGLLGLLTVSARRSES